MTGAPCRTRRLPICSTSRAGATLRRLTLAFDEVASDVYWIRALQHYGDVKRSELADKRYDQLGPLLDITTSLDPHFTIAFRFGAIFLTEEYPNGPGRPDLAIALLEKGLEATPAKWQYAMDIGFVHYWWLHDYRAAAAWFRKAHEIPDSPWWLESLAASTVAHGGDRQASRVLWQQISETADHDWLRSEADRRLSQLVAMDELDRLEEIVHDFALDAGAFPGTWDELVSAGYVTAPPVDPAGAGYLLEPRSGTVALSADSLLFPLPTEPPRVAPVP